MTHNFVCIEEEKMNMVRGSVCYSIMYVCMLHIVAVSPPPFCREGGDRCY